MDINALSFTAPFSAQHNAKSSKPAAQTGFAALMEQTAAADGTAASSLETMLKAKYPKGGSIVNAVSGGGGSGGSGGRITQSGSEVDWWDLRSKRHKKYMKLWQERQTEHQMMLSARLGAQDARSTLLNMLNDNTLRTLGDTIGGVSTSEIFAMIRQELAPVQM